MYVFKTCSNLNPLHLSPKMASTSGAERTQHESGMAFSRIRASILAVAVCLSASSLLFARQTSGSAANATPSGAAPNAETTTGTISGTVLDPNGSEIEDARVILTDLNGRLRETVQSRSNGEFTFSGLAPGKFKVTVSGKGWGSYVSPEIQLHPGDFKYLNGVVLPPATISSVSVTANPVTLSEEQVQIAVKQRVLGVFPNFYTAYSWNAPPMRAKQKFQLALRDAIDPVEVAGSAVIAGIEQYNNDFPSWGSGPQGYAKRFGGAYAGSVTSKMIANALLPSIFRQDPRYFYKGNGSGRSRAWYAIGQTFIARGDNGRWQPNYSHLIGNFASAAASNLYYPASDRGLTLTLANSAVNFGDEAGTNLLREFVLKRFTTRRFGRRK